MHIYTRELLDKHLLPELKEIAHGLGIIPEGNKTCRETWIAALVGQPFPLFQSIIQEAENTPGVDRAQEPIRKNSSGFDRAQEPIRKNSSGFDRAQEPIRKNFPGVEVDRVFEATVNQSAIAPAVKNHIEDESDWNSIVRRVTFSDRFLARYSPPQPEIIHFQSDADGQLSLLDFEVQSQPEPPDPDDFESLDAFGEDLALWDCEHPSTFDCFCDIPSSAHSDLLQVSLDSFCEWAPCPADWYEPVALQPSEVIELSPACKSSSTSEFFIPTFECLGDRSDRSDEPPDTGIYARRPKPKPPSFPPTTAGQARVKRIPNAYQTHLESIPKLSRNYPETIPKLFSVVVGSSTQLARSPPGGEAM